MKLLRSLMENNKMLEKLIELSDGNAGAVYGHRSKL